MSEIEPITREELLLNSIAGEGTSDIEPITRQEMYLSAIAGESDLPASIQPITREEIYYQKILDNGGGGGGGDEPTGTKNINITENGVTTHNIKAYATAQITANVPNSYSVSDEGKVVDNGDLVSQTSKNITSNGTVDTTLNNSVVVNVPQGITPTGTKEISITENGTTTEDVTNYASAQITANVPNSYSASDEGKVVDNGALVAQTSHSITANGTYDTTLNDEVVVSVSGGGAGTRKATYTTVDTSLDTPQKLYNALKTATGFTNLYAVVQSELPESGACVRSIVWITGVHGELGSQSGFDYACYRRATNGTWANATTYGASITVPTGTEFAVYEIQPYE